MFEIVFAFNVIRTIIHVHVNIILDFPIQCFANQNAHVYIKQ